MVPKKRREIGDPVVTIEHLITSLCPIDTLSHISKTFPVHYMELQCSPKLTRYVPIIRFLLTHAADIPKTAISTPLFEFVRMPFGLRNAAQSFQRFMDQVLRGLDFCYIYFDDLLVASASPDQHKEHLRLVFERLRHYGMIINPQKCKFGVASVEFLGHLVDSTGIHPLQDKVQAIRDFPQPTSKRQLSTFPGLVNFYHRFFPNGAQILHPLNALFSSTDKHCTSLSWDETSSTAFNTIKEVLASTTLLIHPKPHALTSVMTDASDAAVGAVLQQYIDGH